MNKSANKAVELIPASAALSAGVICPPSVQARILREEEQDERLHSPLAVATRRLRAGIPHRGRSQKI